MSYEWHYDLSTDRPDAIEALGDLYTAYALEGEFITQNSLCQVIRVELDGVGYFVKKYRRGSDRRWALFSKSAARKEWENLLQFSLWELPAARVVAWGEESLLGVAGHGIVITEEVSGAESLSSLIHANSSLLASQHWLKSISKQLATVIAALHRHKFSLNDLNWRNIVCSSGEREPKITLLGCTSGRVFRESSFERQRIQDLAGFDKVAASRLSRSQCLRFYYHYRNINKLTVSDKLVVKRVVNFFKGQE